MIRMKAKSWLLSIALIMACFCFFACKDTKVNAESISFTEQTISMLVGEEYSPSIKILPSYATNRSYTLISDDVTALKVNGGTITALKAGKGIKLKVVSNENNNINDIITVNIYAEATTLASPSNLTFDGNNFSFVGEDNGDASSYVLSINDESINIGNNTEYSIANVINKLGADKIYNQELRCEVKAVGDGKIFKDSNYSSAVSFVKLSKIEDAYIDVGQQVLYFDAISNVGKYTVEVWESGVLTETTATTSNRLDIAYLTNSDDGAEYDLKIVPDVNTYSNSSVLVYDSGATEIKYTTIGKVDNLAISERTLSWDFVENAESYTVRIYKGGAFLRDYQNITANYIQLQDTQSFSYSSGDYYCDIIANSNKINTVTGKNYSNKLNFTILPAPVVVTENNVVTWQDIIGAEGYLVTITNASGVKVVDNKFVIDNVYDVSAFDADKYNIQVIACGNGREILTSTISTNSSWVVLAGVQLSIENKKLYWTDTDSETLNTYSIKIVDSTDNVVEEKLLTNVEYDDAKGMFEYDLSIYDFEPDTYTILMQSLGGGTIFDARVDNCTLIKLADSSIKDLSRKQFILDAVSNAVSYQINIYNESDVEISTPIKEFSSLIDGNKIYLDDADLNAGKYVAKVFVYGNNGGYIFDADNASVEEGENATILRFEKLETPTITVDAVNLKLVVETIDKAEGYELYQANNNLNIVGQEYSLNGLTAGDYVYTVKAVGDNAKILDSAITTSAQAIKIKKLATPTVTFNKNDQTYAIACPDAQYVFNYSFILNDGSEEYDIRGVKPTSNQVDCSAFMGEASTYTVEVTANPKESDDYNLIIKSASTTNISSRIDAECTFEIYETASGVGKLKVIPTGLRVSDYNLKLRIDDGKDADLSNDIILTEFNYNGSVFEIDLYNRQYNAINDNVVKLLQNPQEYRLYATISQDRADVISSQETAVSNSLTVLNRVENINKNAQTIEFDVIDNAVNYIAVVELNGVETYIDIAGKYNQSGTKNVLKIADLITLMDVFGVAYVENNLYSISFVAIPDNSSYMPNKGVDKFEYEFLAVPTISIVEKTSDMDGYTKYGKYISISNSDTKVNAFNITITQNEQVKDGVWSKLAGSDYTYVNLDEMIQFTDGKIDIEIKAVSSSDNNFDSKLSTVTVNKIVSAELSINEGKLVWAEIPNVKQYNLMYIKNGRTRGVGLSLGAENFTIQDGQCYYEFAGLGEGLTTLYLQADSVLNVGRDYYINSNNGAMLANIYKLSTPVISVVDGEIYTEISAIDREYMQKAEIKVDGQLIDINITEAQGNDVRVVEQDGKLAITINPAILLKYGTTSLATEQISLKIYSNQATVLNSSIAFKDVRGLLCPTNLDITTSNNKTGTGVIDEVFEKITWTNPIANGENVTNYEIIINYNEIDYTLYSDTNAFIMPSYYDSNNNERLDDGETEFGAGVYTIRVRALTNSNNDVVNSKYCDSIVVTVLDTPTDLATVQGNIVWSSNINVEYYLIRVYLLTRTETVVGDTIEVGYTSQLAVSSVTSNNLNKFDLSNLVPLTTGVYGVTVQAMHDDTRVLASKESEMLQVIRLPQVESYFVQNGRLYINVHSFYSSAQIYVSNGTRTETFTIINNNTTKYNSFVESMTDWATSKVLDTYNKDAVDNYYVAEEYVGTNNDGILRGLTAGEYNVKVKLIGNSSSTSSIISGQTGIPVNSNLTDDETVTSNNLIIKPVAPSVKVSSLVRGKLLFDIPDDVVYDMSYYKDGDTALKGVHLYEVNILVGQKYTMYVAQIVDEQVFKDSVGENAIITENSLKRFEYGGYTFNVIEEDVEGGIGFNFDVILYHYYSIQGLYSSITLSEGGDFVLNAKLMGDDTKFVHSNISNSGAIRRYEVLNVKVNNGELVWKNQASNVDHPVYLLNLIDTNSATEYNIVLYNADVYNTDEDIAEIKACLDAGKTYKFDRINYQIGEDIRYSGLANIINAINGGTYNVSVAARFTSLTSNDKLLAQQEGGAITVSILPKATFGVKDGALTWNMVNIVDTDSGTEGVTLEKYKLEVFDSLGEKIYDMELNLADADYKVLNNIATYDISNKEEFELQAEQNYIFKLTVIGDSSGYVNSVVNATNETYVLSALQNVGMKDGMLTWYKAPEASGEVEVYVTYKSGGNDVVYSSLVTGNSFVLPMSAEVNGTTTYFVTGNEYRIKVRLRGGTTTINGVFSTEITTQRLATVNKEYSAVGNKKGIDTVGGILTWSPSVIDVVKEDGTIIPVYASSYSVNYTIGGESYVINGLTDTQYDFTGIDAGEITVSIQAHHNDYFSSSVSDSVTLFKLSTPTGIKFNEGTNTISWTKVLDKDNNEINDYLISIKENGVVVGEPQQYSAEEGVDVAWFIAGVTSTSFEIAVKAVSKEDGGILINSDYTEYLPMTQPSRVDAETFVFDAEKQAFKWKAVEGEQTEDEYYIWYQVSKRVENPESAGEYVYSEPESVEKIIVTSSEITSDGKYYYYYPVAIGSYTQVYVQVIRAGSLSSQRTYCGGQIDKEIVFNIFACGDGSVDNPYIIQNETHLRNIPYFLKANYVIVNNIELESDLPITNSSQIFGGVIATPYTQDEETGELVYEVKTISRKASTSTASGSTLVTYGGNVGLFHSVSGATFKNLKLTNFKYDGLLNQSTLNMGVLAGSAINSVFDNISVVSSSIKLTNYNSGEYISTNADIYIGAVVGYADNTVLTNCTINLGNPNNTGYNIDLYVLGNSSIDVAVGALAGYAHNCTFASNRITEENTSEATSTATAFAIKYTTMNPAGGNPPKTYIGSVVGVASGTIAISNNYCKKYAVVTTSGGTIYVETEIGYNA